MLLKFCFSRRAENDRIFSELGSTSWPQKERTLCVYLPSSKVLRQHYLHTVTRSLRNDKYYLNNLTLCAPCIILQYVYEPTRCTKILVIRLYFPLDVLHVSDYISPSSEATFISCTSHLVYAGICRYHTSGCCVAVATQQPDVPAYTKCDVQLIKLLLKMD